LIGARTNTLSRLSDDLKTETIADGVYKIADFPLIHWRRRTADMAENYRQQREGLTAMSLGAIAARLPTGLWQASPATCRASVAR
jgi:hypothetical protein